MRMFCLVVFCFAQCFFSQYPAVGGEKETIAAIFKGHVQRRKQLAGLVFEYECCRKYEPHSYWNRDEGGIRQESGVWFNETLMIRYCDQNLELPFAYHWMASYQERPEQGASQEAAWADDVWGDKRIEFSNWNKTSRFWSRPMRGKEPRLRDFLEPHAFLENFLSKGVLHDDSVTAHYLTGCDFAEALSLGLLNDPHGKYDVGAENRHSLAGMAEVAGVQCTVLKPTDPAYGKCESVIATAPDFVPMKIRIVEEKNSFAMDVSRVARFEGLLYPVDIRITQDLFTHVEVEIRNVRVRRINNEDVRKWDFPFPAGSFVSAPSYETFPWPDGFEERVNIAFLQNFRIKQASRNIWAISSFVLLVSVVGIVIYRMRSK
ncbi:MAG: hypothetical protein WCK15_01385 [Pirellula sp.]